MLNNAAKIIGMPSEYVTKLKEFYSKNGGKINNEGTMADLLGQSFGDTNSNALNGNQNPVPSAQAEASSLITPLSQIGTGNTNLEKTEVNMSLNSNPSVSNETPLSNASEVPVLDSNLSNITTPITPQEILNQSNDSSINTLPNGAINSDSSVESINVASASSNEIPKSAPETNTFDSPFNLNAGTNMFDAPLEPISTVNAPVQAASQNPVEPISINSVEPQKVSNSTGLDNSILTDKIAKLLKDMSENQVILNDISDILKTVNKTDNSSDDNESLEKTAANQLFDQNGFVNMNEILGDNTNNGSL